MEQRVYVGNIDPNGLADFLVQTFNQNFSYSGWSDRYQTMAQKVGQGDQILVQVARARTSSGRIRGALGVSISRTSNGVSVSTGQSNWLDLDDPSIAGTLIGSLFFPPLLIFPVLRGIHNYTFYQDVWQAIDTYCTQGGAHQGSTTTAHGIYCPYCGTINDETVQQCQTCGAPLQAQQGQPQQQAAQQATQYYTPPPRSPQQPQQPAQEMVICPRCGQRVPAANFCNNCANPLRETSGTQQA